MHSSLVFSGKVLNDAQSCCLYILTLSISVRMLHLNFYSSFPNMFLFLTMICCVKMWMNVRKVMEDVQKYASTPRALIDVSVDQEKYWTRTGRAVKILLAVTVWMGAAAMDAPQRTNHITVIVPGVWPWEMTNGPVKSLCSVILVP